MSSLLFKHGRKWFSPETVDARLFSSLTGAELLVLEGLGAGLGNQEIADRHGIGVRTVKAHINRMGLKAGVKGQMIRVRLGVAWALYARQYDNCELFHKGKIALVNR